MTNQEKEAIEIFQKYIDFCKNNKECREELKNCFGCTVEVEEINAMQTLLNLIQKQEKEIKELQDKNDVQRFLIRELDYKNTIPDIDDKILNYVDKAEYNKALKIIDEIYEFAYKFGEKRLGSFFKELKENGFDIKQCKKCFEDDKLIYESCKICIKQYFYRKVEKKDS